MTPRKKLHRGYDRSDLEGYGIRKKSGCLIWPGGKGSGGYGILEWDGKNNLIHRVVMEQKLGRKLATTEFVCHHCDVKLCYEIKHLYVGTVKTNAKDAMERRLYRYGERHPRAVLNNRLVRRIRRLLAAGTGVNDIRKMMGLSYHLVDGVAKNKCWKGIV